MSGAELPKHVRDLIERHIDSVQQVEILVLLRGQSDNAWHPADVSRALHIAPGPCRTWLEQFAAAGLVTDAGMGFRHGAAKRVSRIAVDDLVDLYPRRRLSVIDAIYNKPDG